MSVEPPPLSRWPAHFFLFLHFGSAKTCAAPSFRDRLRIQHRLSFPRAALFRYCNLGTCNSGGPFPFLPFFWNLHSRSPNGFLNYPPTERLPPVNENNNLFHLTHHCQAVWHIPPKALPPSPRDFSVQNNDVSFWASPGPIKVERRLHPVRVFYMFARLWSTRHAGFFNFFTPPSICFLRGTQLTAGGPFVTYSLALLLPSPQYPLAVDLVQFPYPFLSPGRCASLYNTFTSLQVSRPLR